jgi:hypothetical protein
MTTPPTDPYIKAHRSDPSLRVAECSLECIAYGPEDPATGDRAVLDRVVAGPPMPRGFARYLAHKHRHEKPQTDAEAREERRRVMEACWDEPLRVGLATTPTWRTEGG